MTVEETNLQISNLSINTGYRVSVVAATAAGMGMAANQTGRTDEDGIIHPIIYYITSEPIIILQLHEK